MSAPAPRPRILALRGVTRSLERPLIMGIVNATPDSFFDRGRYFAADDPAPAIARAERLVEEGADIIDIGGETAQPNSPVLDADEEIRRIVPVIERLAGRIPVPISVDTYKPSVARAAIAAGAVLINDTSGLAHLGLAEVAAETGAGIVVMHIAGHPKERTTPGYPDPVAAVTAFLAEKLAILATYGVVGDRVLVDPGIGFAKTPRESLQLTERLSALSTLGSPILYACSRRTFLGDFFGGEPPEARLDATLAMNGVALEQGADVLRVHDVRVFAKLVHTRALIQSSVDPERFQRALIDARKLGCC